MSSQVWVEDNRGSWNAATKRHKIPLMFAICVPEMMLTWANYNYRELTTMLEIQLAP